MIHVIEARYVSDYKIHIVFSDKTEGIVDLQDIIQDHRPLFKELADIKKFKKFKVDLDTVVWENGLDLAPEFLYSKIKN